MTRAAKVLEGTFEEDLPDYQFDPVAYEREQAARPDEQWLYSVSANWARRLIDKSDHNCAVLDLCCGTGLSVRRIFPHRNLRRVVGLDNCPQYLSFAKTRFLDFEPHPELVEADAVTGSIPSENWDVVMMISAYHHIEDERKLAFLTRVRDLLGSGGRAIVGENVLPEYITGDKDSYCAAIRQFYDRVKYDVIRQNKKVDNKVLMTIERVAKHGFDGDYEYKVKYSVMLNHFEECGLKIIHARRVWPEKPIGGSGGNYVIILRGMTIDELQSRESGANAG
jgi:ubiquinone/menaquinone biosynthesis C-methylase UbiE